MTQISNRSMACTRAAGNQGKMGYIPTSKNIIELEMSLIDFSDLFGKDISINIADLSGGVGDQLYYTEEFLKQKGIECNSYYNELNSDRYQECIEKYKHFNSTNVDIFNLKIAERVGGNGLNKKVFGLIRNNPPYMYIQRYGQNVRAEEEFFIKNSLHDMSGAVHILEVPIHQLSKSFLHKLTYRYSINVFKFPRGEFEKYKQVAVLMQKKKVASREADRVEELLNLISEDAIQFIEDIAAPVIKLESNDFKRMPNINFYRDSSISVGTLNQGLNQVMQDLIEFDRKSVISKNVEVGKPIIERSNGHVAVLLAAGRFDGLLGNLLIKGGSNRIIETTVTEDDYGVKTTTETEYLKPYLELTTKSGNIIYKDF